MLENKEEILQGYEAIIQTLTDTSKLDKETAKLQGEYEVAAEILRKCVEENAYTAFDQEKYQERYTALVERCEAIQKWLLEINNKRLERSAKRESIEKFIRMLEKNDTLLTEFDEELWNGTIEKAAVHSDKVVFTFKDGTELDWGI